MNTIQAELPKRQAEVQASDAALTGPATTELPAAGAGAEAWEDRGVDLIGETTEQDLRMGVEQEVVPRGPVISGGKDRHGRRRCARCGPRGACECPCARERRIDADYGIAST